MSLEEDVRWKKIDGNKGEILDKKRGDVLKIKEEMESGIMDNEGKYGSIIIKIDNSMYVKGLLEKGIMEKDDKKIVNKEKGENM